MKVFKYIFIFSFFFIPFIGNGQVSYFDNLSISMYPESPSPGESVVLSAENFSFDINQSYFSWYINGILTKEGFGEKNIIFTTGEPNEKSLITLTVSTDNNLFLEEQITIQPVEVSLIWEANTSVPIFYKGKSLHTPGSSVKFVAIANVFQNEIKIPSKNLVYTWKNNKKILGSLSGVGKSNITIENKGVLSDLIVSVSVSTKDGLVTGRDFVSIDVARPEIVLYEENSLLGNKYEKGIKNSFDVEEKEVVLFVEPFFFSPGNVLFSWKINRDSVGDSKKSILIKNEESGDSAKNISIEVNHSSYFLQATKDAFRINFTTPLLDSLFNF